MPGYLFMAGAYGIKFGDPVALPTGTAVSADGKALVDLGGGKYVPVKYVTLQDHAVFLDRAVADEARVLPLRRSPAGERHRAWPSVADDSREEAFAD